MKKLFIGNLSYKTTNESLKAFFEKAGAVTEAVVIMERETGRSRGFGFVTMTDDAGFDAALQLHGQELDGRPINVSEAREREDRPRTPRPATGGNRW
jgi:RNA recognition motif-containing protein